MTLAYVALAVLLLNLGFRSHWHLSVKLAAVIITSLFYLATWFGLKQLQGWPSNDQLPEKFRVVGKHIVQPGKQSGTEGAIYIWVTDLAAAAGEEPRAYRLPYIEQLHEDIVKATRKGQRKIGRRIEPVGVAAEQGASSQQMIEFVDEERPRLPAKE